MFRKIASYLGMFRAGLNIGRLVDKPWKPDEIPLMVILTLLCLASPVCDLLLGVRLNATSKIKQ